MGNRRDEPAQGAMAKLGAAQLPSGFISPGRRGDALADGADHAAAEAAPGAGRFDRARGMGGAAAVSFQPRAGADSADQIGLADYRTALDGPARARGHDRNAPHARPDREGQIAGITPARDGFGHPLDRPDPGISRLPGEERPLPRHPD